MKGKRELLLDAALNLFTEKGFHGTPTSMIAKVAGVATGTLFHYFNTKEELINQLYLEIKSDMSESLAKGLEEKESIKEKMKLAWENWINWGINSKVQMRFFNQFGSSPFITKLTKEQGAQNFSFLFLIFNKGIEQQVLKQMPADMLFMISHGSLMSTVIYFMENPDKFSDENCRQQAFDIYWDSIKKS